MVDNARHIQELFQNYGKEGWKSKVISSTQIASGFSGETGNFSLLVEIKEGWVIFVVSDFLDLTGAVQSLDEVYRLLLELNAIIYGVKLSLDSGGKVILVYNVEYDERVEFIQFQTALDLLTFYSDDLYEGLKYRIFIKGSEATP